MIVTYQSVYYNGDGTDLCRWTLENGVVILVYVDTDEKEIAYAVQSVAEIKEAAEAALAALDEQASDAEWIAAYQALAEVYKELSEAEANLNTLQKSVSDKRIQNTRKELADVKETLEETEKKLGITEKDLENAEAAKKKAIADKEAAHRRHPGSCFYQICDYQLHI